MPFPAIDCTAANCIPHRPAQVQQQFDLLLDVARAVCADFVGDTTHQDRWFFVPTARQGAGTRRNLLTVWGHNDDLRLCILQDVPAAGQREVFHPAALQQYQQRMTALYQHMLTL